MDIALVHVSGVHAAARWVRKIPVGIIGARVTFKFDDPLWEGLSKTVVFSGAVDKDVPLEGGSVVIPPEVVAQKDIRVKVGVYGTDSQKDLAIPTLWANLGTVRDAADPSGDTDTDPSLPIWAQLREDVDKLLNTPITWDTVQDKPFDKLKVFQVPEKEVAVNDLGSRAAADLEFVEALEVGKTYTVTIGGEAYSAVCRDYGNMGYMYWFGNPGLLGDPDNGLPYCVVYYPGTGGGIYLKDTTLTTAVISIFQEREKLWEDRIPDNVPVISTAKVGQLVVVEEVDDTGRPTKWGAADPAAGGGSGITSIEIEEVTNNG